MANRTLPPKRRCRSQSCRKTFQPTRISQVYCSRECQKPVTHNVARKTRRAQPTQFIGVDGEGYQAECEHSECLCKRFVGDGASCEQCRHERGEHAHRYVLLGCGSEQYENVEGITWREAFTFLYDQHRKHPEAAFVGFFLGYDFSQILKTLPEDKAWSLLTDQGLKKRTRKTSEGFSFEHPVHLDYERIADGGTGWDVRWLPNRRLSFRPALCDCAIRPNVNCPHPQSDWLHICDSGAFFQQSFMSVINPSAWLDDPICTQAQYDDILAGKERRSSAALDDDMKRYNRLENELLANVMVRLDKGFRALGVKLTSDCWYGPGAAANRWLDSIGAPRRKDMEKALPEPVRQAVTYSYLGGWFEVFAHGTIPGTVHEYDITSAYPSIMSDLPCLLHGKWTHSYNTELAPLKAGEIRLVKTSPGGIVGTDPHIGTMLHRGEGHRITRPYKTGGWHFQHELEAAVRAGLIDTLEIEETWSFRARCSCPPPYAKVVDLFDFRLTQISKTADGQKVETPAGKAAKLLLNSLYGKLAQSVGGRPFASLLCASLITAGTRTMILDAIASHPQRSASALMVATDAIFFTSEHPSLPCPKAKTLGQWEKSDMRTLTIFKPGAYWHDEARQRIAEGGAPIFKARGISAKAFAAHLARVDQDFEDFAAALVNGEVLPWPSATYEVGFAMVTARNALHRRKWATAGRVSTAIFTQSADPSAKRCEPYSDTAAGFVRSRPIEAAENLTSYPYTPKYVEDALIAMTGEKVLPVEDPDFTPDGATSALYFGALGTGQFR